MNEAYTQYVIEPVDFKTASDDIFELNYEFAMLMISEGDPDEPDFPKELWKTVVRQDDPKYVIDRWMAMDSSKVVGSAVLHIFSEKSPNYETDKHICMLTINVHPKYRNSGLGSKLTKMVLEKIQTMPRITTIFADVTLESGKKFSEKLGGKISKTRSESRLRLAEVNWGLLKNWKQSGEILSKREGVKIQYFEQCPEDIIEAYTDLYTEVMNQRPLGDYDGKSVVTPESRREDERRQAERGLLWYTFITRESDGTISSLTEMFYSPGTPHKGYQNMTGVQERYRGRGLGKWLKAHMLEWLYAKYPDIVYIETGNATSNKPMLSINNRMGYKVFLEGISYSFKVENLLTSYKL